jgi:multidrug resistance efflux pump
LERLRRLEVDTNRALTAAKAVDQGRKEVKELENSSGSIGGIVDAARASLKQAEADLDRTLSSASTQIDAIVGTQ